MNTRVLYPLVRPTVRAVNWLPLVIGAGLGAALLLVPEALTTKLTEAHLTTLARLAAACAAVGAAFVLDDPATRTIPTVPTARLVRNAVRVVPVAAALAVWWLLLLRLATAAAHHPTVTHLPGGGLSVEAATMAGVALALAAAVQRRSTDGNYGLLAAPGLLAFVALAWVLPRRVALVVGPDDPRWAVAHQRWTVGLVVALAVFVWAGREPVSRSVGRTQPACRERHEPHQQSG